LASGDKEDFVFFASAANFPTFVKVGCFLGGELID
jgi:hypothetical protein